MFNSNREGLFHALLRNAVQLAYGRDGQHKKFHKIFIKCYGLKFLTIDNKVTSVMSLNKDQLKPANLIVVKKI